MKNSTLKFLLLISVILNIAVLGTVGYSYYQHSLRKPAPFGPGRRAFLARELSLNPDQVTVLEKNEQAFHNQIDAMRQQILLKRIALLNLMKSDKPDTKKIDQTISDIGNMQEGIQRKIVAHIIEVKTMLNNEQQKQFFGLIETIITKREDGRHGPHGPGH
jgi:Spy/CpxP family protein refolding chaperone